MKKLRCAICKKEADVRVAIRIAQNIQQLEKVHASEGKK